MITIEPSGKQAKPQGVRKATLTKKAVARLRLEIDCALQEEIRRRLGSSAVNFLSSIRRQISLPVIRLSAKQRHTADEILAEAFSDRALVFLEGTEMMNLARLISHAKGHPRASALAENVMVTLQRRLGEPVIALSEKQWRIIEDVKQKTHFDLPGEPTPMDIDGVVENDDPDGWPLKNNGSEFDQAQYWETVGVTEDADY